MGRIVEDGAVEFRNVPDVNPDSLPEEPEHSDDSTGLEHRVILTDNISNNSVNFKSQDEWIQYWNDINDGRIMASMSDYYAIFKQIQSDILNGTVKAKGEAVNILTSLKKDFWSKKMVTSTRMEYNSYHGADLLESKIIHNHACRNKALIKETPIYIPVLRGKSIAEALEDHIGLEYIQIFFGTKDNKEEIIELMELISGKDRNAIMLWTPDIASRRQCDQTTALLCYYHEKEEPGSKDLFAICYNTLQSAGISRGIKYG